MKLYQGRALLTFLIQLGVTASELSGADGSFDHETGPMLGGPGSGAAQLLEDEAWDDDGGEFLPRASFVDPWFAWKEGLKENYGLQFGLAYTSLFQGVSDTLSHRPNTAGSGILRVSAQWESFNRGSEDAGSLVVGVDHRHSYSSIAPSRLGESVGYLGNTASRFNDAAWIMGDLYWRQRFNDGRSALILGRFSPIEFFDTLGYANPWTTFQNHSILHNSTITQPDWSTGLAIGHRITDQWYFRCAVSDANGSDSGTQWLHDLSELFSAGEIGWSPSPEERESKSLHLSAWHSDARDSISQGSSSGLAIGVNWSWNQQEQLFFRASLADGNASIFNQSITVGGIHTFQSSSAAAGIALNWGKPSDNTLDDQWTGEMFCRLEITENLTLTPSAQVLFSPALNPTDRAVLLGGVRMRLTF